MASRKEQNETLANRPRSREPVKAPLKELRDIMNMTKAKMPLGEMSRFGDLTSLIPKSTTSFNGTKHQNLIPEGPRKVVAKHEFKNEKVGGENCAPDTMSSKVKVATTVTSTSTAASTINPHHSTKNNIVPAAATSTATSSSAVQTKLTAAQSAAPPAKKSLSIRIPESSPKAQQVKLFQFKSLSTKHANEGKIAAAQQSSPGVLPLQPACNIIIPNHEPAKCSLKRNGVVRAYAASTNQGLVR